MDQLTGAEPQQSGEGSHLSRLVAKGGSRRHHRLRPARRPASEAEFDAKADTALFTGDVVVNQLRNVLQGKRLFIDRKAGTSRLETPAEDGQPAGRIAATFYQSDNKGGAAVEAEVRSRQAAAAAAAPDGVMGSFKMDPNAPMDIEADTLDVLRHREARRVPRQRQVQAGRFHRAHRRDDRSLLGPGRTWRSRAAATTLRARRSRS